MISGLIALALFILLPYVVLFMIKGTFLSLKEYTKVKEYFKALISDNSPGFENDPINERKHKELDRIDKSAKEPKKLGEARWIDSPTPEEEEKDTTRKLLEENRKFKETKAKNEQSK